MPDSPLRLCDRLALAANLEAGAERQEAEATRMRETARQLRALEAEPGPPKLLDARAVGELLSIPHKRVYELREKGELPGVRVGNRSWRWPERVIRQWIEERTGS